MKVLSSSVIVLAGALVATAFAIAEPLPRPANDNTPPPHHGEHDPAPVPHAPRRRRQTPITAYE
ncbi:MAG: hypothetical protein ACM30I_09395 [Gemmatimonas sp.]